MILKNLGIEPITFTILPNLVLKPNFPRKLNPTQEDLFKKIMKAKSVVRLFDLGYLEIVDIAVRNTKKKGHNALDRIKRTRKQTLKDAKNKDIDLTNTFIDTPSESDKNSKDVMLQATHKITGTKKFK